MNEIKLYRPSNGTEGEAFMAENCYHCQWDNDEIGCPIQTATWCYDKEASEYPNQWRYNEEDEPTCIAFVEKET